MVQVNVVEVDIVGASFWVHPIGPNVLAESLGKPLLWAIGFSFGNTELSMELWTAISGVSGFDD